MKRILFIIFFASVLLNCQNRPLKIDYFGETPPGNTPKVFAKNSISLKDRWEGNMNFSTNGKELYFNVFKDSIKTIYHSSLKKGKWTAPSPMHELQGQNTWEPFITWDMDRLFFVSDRPPGSPEWDGRIWYLDRDDENQWGMPKYFDMGVDPKLGLWFPNETQNNELYFGAALKDVDSIGSGDMYRMDLRTKKVSLLRGLCSESEDWDPFVAPDESYILWASDRPGGYGGTDLYISFKNIETGTWEAPKNLGSKINTENYEVAPRVTADGKYLFFDRPIKGTQDIYWVSTAALLRQ